MRQKYGSHPRGKLYSAWLKLIDIIDFFREQAFAFVDFLFSLSLLSGLIFCYLFQSAYFGFILLFFF
jgi:hypothetical protein